VETSSGFANRVPVCTDPGLAAGVCRCDARMILWKNPYWGHLRWDWGPSEAMAATRIQSSFFGHACAASLERPVLHAARIAGLCAVCDSSFSFARQISRFGIASSERVANRFRAGQRPKPHGLSNVQSTPDAMSHDDSLITARTLRATQTQICDAENKRSECRGVRKRPAGFRKTPRLVDPRGSRRDGGRSETRPRVKLDYRATAPRS
jgi:hypothetical protein